MTGILQRFCRMFLPAALAFSLPAHAQCDRAPAPAFAHDAAGQPMHLTFEDRFAGPGLDRHVWSTGLASPVNSDPHEQQDFVPHEVIIRPGGGLRLQIDKQATPGARLLSGAINSQAGFTQTFGRFEICARLPGGMGTWPAFWLMPADASWPPEIDIFEYLGRLPSKPHHGVLVIKNGKRLGRGDYAETGVDMSQDFHRYAVDWRPGQIVFTIDGRATYQVTGDIPAQPMYMIANFSMGGGWAKPYDRSTPFPGHYDINDIRVYQYDDVKPPPPPAMQFVKPHFVKPALLCDRAVKAAGGIRIGGARLDDIDVHMTLRSQDGSREIARQDLRVRTAAPHSTVMLAPSFALPALLLPGIYELQLTATAKRAGQTEKLWLGQADQLEQPEIACRG